MSLTLLSIETSETLNWVKDYSPLAVFVGYLTAYFYYVFNFRNGTKKFLQSGFSKGLWLSKSFLVDLIFTIAIYFNLLALSGSTAKLTNFSEELKFWLAEHLSAYSLEIKQSFLVYLLLSIVALLIIDLWTYFWHRLFHEAKLLWFFHAVHHSGTRLTPITIFRVHPVELIFKQVFKPYFLIFFSIFGVISLNNPNPKFLALAFLPAIGFHTLIVKTLSHSELAVRFPRWLSHIFISPAMHQIHHSKLPQHTDKNFGAVLSIFDFLFGTLFIPSKDEIYVYGINSEAQNLENANFFELIYKPLIGAYQFLIEKIKISIGKLLRYFSIS